MNALAILLTMSLLAVALTATATLSSGLSALNGGTFTDRQAIRLRNILITSFVLMIAALVPVPILLLDLTGDLAWRIASGIAAALSLVSNAVGLRTARQARSIEQTSKTVIAASLILSGATFGCFLLGVVADQPSFWFVTALFLIVIICLMSLMRLLFSLPILAVLED